MKRKVDMLEDNMLRRMKEKKIWPKKGIQKTLKSTHLAFFVECATKTSIVGCV